MFRLCNFHVAIAAFSAVASAAYSDPFHLAVRSDNGTYNNKAVTACHQGGQLTSLCVSSQEPSLNETGPFALDLQTTTSGSLGLENPIPDPNSTLVDYFPMNLQYNPYTNIAMGFFSPPLQGQTNNADRLLFNDDDLLVMYGPVLDDRLAPNWQAAPANATLNRWYVCDTWAPAPYRTTAVVWGLGEAEPQNPTCVKVDVVRVT